MKPRPEDGNLENITSSGLNSEYNTIVIQRTDEFEEPDKKIFIFATWDRTREGVEWTGDKVLERLIPELPKVKTLEVKKPDITTKTISPHRHRIERKSYQRPVQRNFTTTRRTKPPSKKFCSERSKNPSSVNDIDPWVYKPWENQTLFSGLNSTASVSASSLISTESFNNFNIPSSAPSLPFPPKTSSNILNVPNSSAYEKTLTPTAIPNMPFINTHFRPPPTNRLPIGLHPPFPLQNRFPQHPNSRFRAPVPNNDLEDPSHKSGLLGDPPTARFPVKQGLLGERPFPNMQFNRNLVRLPNSISTQSIPEGNTQSLHPRNEDVGGKNSFAKNNSFGNSYDTAYGEIPRSNFDLYEDSNEISGQKSHDSYRYRSSGSSVNHYKDHSYNNLGLNRVKNKNRSSKNSRDSRKANYGKFQKPFFGVRRTESGYKEFGDSNPHESNYKDSHISSISEPSTFMNNQNRNTEDDSLIHISDSAVVYNPEDYEDDGYPAAASDSISRSNLSSVPRSNNTQNFYTKSTLGTKKRWTTNKFTNNNDYRPNRVKYNQGQQRFKKWRPAQK